ncbi:MAG: SusC/RagA family TonB-linked outer membrane protein, partial [Mediterranea sp.]|nr:SusC/RagA family TonB-linked outer membrane protein [Mediterranea sp.]
NQRANNTLDDVPGAGGLGYMAFTVPDGENLIGSDGKLNPSATLGKIIGDYLIIPDDYFKEAFRTGVRQEYNLSINGGNDKATYYTSFGYLNNEGIVPGSEYERITGKINASWTANDWLTTGVNANYSHSKRNGVDDNYQTSVFSFATIMGPIYPLYIRHADGSFYTDDRGRMYDYGNGDNAGLQRGPISNSNALQTDILDVSGRVGNSITAQAYADIRFLKDFKFTVNINVANDQRRSTAALNPWYGYNAMYDGYINKAETRVFSVNTQQLLNWGKTFGHHDISAMVGHEYYDWRTEYLDGVKTGALDYKGKPELSAAILISSTDSYAWYYNTEGYFGRALYDYNKQYFASMSFRRDGSSRFHPDHRWGNFWSLGGAWLINKETWFDASWVDMLKLKASYGEQGNDNLGTSYEYQYYLYTDMYSIANNANTVALPFYQKGNKEITWEKNGNFNAGVEFELFKGRLTGNFEYFYRKTSDMLTYFSLPISRGYAGYYDNVGDMTNNGLELSLTGTVLKMKDLKWDISLNTTWYKNKVTLLNEERKTVTIDGYNGYVDGYYFVAEGQPRYTWYLRQYAGPDPTTGQSTWYYTDKTTGELKTTTNWSNADYHLCGTPTPDLYGGFSTNLTWKDFDLSANFSYQIGGLVYDSAYSSLMRSPTTSGSGTNMHVDVLQSWTPENTQTDIPRWYYSDIAQDSDRWLINGSYLSMENITLGYTLPASLIKKAGINSLRLSVSCDNVFFLSKRNGLDPRYNIDGSTSGSTYTPIRSISGGIKIQF